MENIKTLITFVRHQNLDASLETKKQDIQNAIQEVKKSFDVTTDVYVYRRIGKEFDSYFLTYKANIPENQKESPIQNTRFIHRNPRTNTFFTINAVNRLCLMEIGRVDPEHKINWRKYPDKLLMLKNNIDGDQVLRIYDIERVEESKDAE